MVGEKIYIVKIMKTVTVTEYDHLVRKVVEDDVEISANTIAEDDEYVTFYDKWGDVSGRFRKDAIVGFYYNKRFDEVKRWEDIL